MSVVLNSLLLAEFVVALRCLQNSGSILPFCSTDGLFRPIKKPVIDRLLNNSVPGLENLHAADVLVKPALMTSSLVLVKQALARHAVDNRHGFFVGLTGQILVTGSYCLDHILDMRAQHGSLTCFARAAFVRLTCALSCLCRISQNRTPETGLKQPVTMLISRPFVNQIERISTL